MNNQRYKYDTCGQLLQGLSKRTISVFYCVVVHTSLQHVPLQNTPLQHTPLLPLVAFLQQSESNEHKKLPH
jgi:hypothetical protein